MVLYELSLRWQLYPDRHTVRCYVDRNYKELVRIVKITDQACDVIKNKLSLVSTLLDKIKAHRAAITKSLKDAACILGFCKYDFYCDY